MINVFFIIYDIQKPSLITPFLVTIPSVNSPNDAQDQIQETVIVGVIKVASALQGHSCVINVNIAALLLYLMGKPLENCTNCQFYS